MKNNNRKINDIITDNFGCKMFIQSGQIFQSCVHNIFYKTDATKLVNIINPFIVLHLEQFNIRIFRTSVIYPKKL